MVARVALHQLSKILTSEWFCNVGFAATCKNTRLFVRHRKGGNSDDRDTSCLLVRFKPSYRIDPGNIR